MKKVKHVSLGDKVFAKVKGYPAWPARVDEDLGKRYKVYFYGTGETGMVKAEDLFPYLEHKDQFTKSLKRKDYNDAIEEIEAAIAEDGYDASERETNTFQNETEEDLKRGLKRKLSVDSTSGSESKKKSTQSKHLLPEHKKSTQTTPVRSSEEDKHSEVKEKINNKDILNRGGKKLIIRYHSQSLIKMAKCDLRNLPEAPIDPLKTDFFKPSHSFHIHISLSILRNFSLLYHLLFALEEENEMDETFSNNDSTESAKFKILTPQTLRETLAELEKSLQDTDKLQEEYTDGLDKIPQNELLLARVAPEKYIGIKLNRNIPEKGFSTHADWLRWRERDYKIALQTKENVENGTIRPEDESELFEFDPELTNGQLRDALKDRIMERKRIKLKFLKVEASLVELDASIKTNLALDKANPKEALKNLDVMLDLNIDQLMLKKHPHVMDMIKRLRRYIGNVKEWKLEAKELEDFKTDAALIRAKADVVYGKFRELFTIPDDKTFWEYFSDECDKFKNLTKDMAENQMFVLCAEPGTKQADLDEVDDREEIKLMSEKNEKKSQDKENSSQIINSEETFADTSAENSDHTHTSPDSHS